MTNHKKEKKLTKNMRKNQLSLLKVEESSVLLNLQNRQRSRVHEGLDTFSKIMRRHHLVFISFIQSVQSAIVYSYVYICLICVTHNFYGKILLY